MTKSATRSACPQPNCCPHSRATPSHGDRSSESSCTVQLYRGSDLAGWRLAKTKNCLERLVDAPPVLRADVANQISKPAGADRPTCSTSTLVAPSRSISGRNEAGRALNDVGATRKEASGASVQYQGVVSSRDRRLRRAVSRRPVSRRYLPADLGSYVRLNMRAFRFQRHRTAWRLC